MAALTAIRALEQPIAALPCMPQTIAALQPAVLELLVQVPVPAPEPIPVQAVPVVNTLAQRVQVQLVEVPLMLAQLGPVQRVLAEVQPMPVLHTLAPLMLVVEHMQAQHMQAGDTLVVDMQPHMQAAVTAAITNRRTNLRG
jgi:hypothetical protein